MKIQSVALEQKSDLGAAVASLPWLPEVVKAMLSSRRRCNRKQPSWRMVTKSRRLNKRARANYPQQMTQSKIQQNIFLVQFGKTIEAKWCVAVEELMGPLPLGDHINLFLFRRGLLHHLCEMCFVFQS